MRAWCESLNVRGTRRQRQLAAEGRAEAPKDLLAREGGQSGKDPRTADDREKVCTALPSFEDALPGGCVGRSCRCDRSVRSATSTSSVTAEFLAHSGDLLADAERDGCRCVRTQLP